MPKYNCAVIFDASSTVIVEAVTPEEAAEIAQDQAEGNQHLCHQCSDTLETGDAIGVHVYDEACTKQLLDTTYQPPAAQLAPVQGALVWKLKDEWLGRGLEAHITAREYNDKIFYIQRCYEFIGLPPAAQPAVPEGWKLVPVKPTQDMKRAWVSALSPDDAWEAMLAAAPEKGGAA